MTAQLHFGRWQDVLAHVDAVDAVICDPPYWARTHGSSRATTDHIAGNVMPDGAKRTPIAYDAMMPSEVAAFVEAWAPRCSGWMLAMTDDELVPVWKDAMRAAGRYAFAAVPIIQKRPRLAGDGPSS